ncbi:hypothetical protein [Actinomadura gamaensis]|uniref:GIY-YIG domain-containing protein n=1 Tax=Actinomadura gamaensis TaxID=1763541 RepID=A0ABV9TXU1_9ACTN
MREDRRLDTERFYALLDELAARLGGPRRLEDCTETDGWPRYGVEFFLEDGQVRAGEDRLRVVRVGSHALKADSKTSFWSRLAQHRGPVTGSNAGVGNHRGSIFRHHVGSALLQTGQWPTEVQTSWTQPKVSPTQRTAEAPLERAVSDHIGAMPLLWLDVPDREQRKLIRANSIALLSRCTGGTHPISPGWLGMEAANENVRRSGLWNSEHVDDPYDPTFLDAMEARVKAL